MSLNRLKPYHSLPMIQGWWSNSSRITYSQDLTLLEQSKNDGDRHFCNSQFKILLTKYGVSSYSHPISPANKRPSGSAKSGVRGSWRRLWEHHRKTNQESSKMFYRYTKPQSRHPHRDITILTSLWQDMLPSGQVQASEKWKIQLNEMDFQQEAYENAKIYKEKIKT